MEVEGDWVNRGFFDLADREAGESFTQRLRTRLATALGLGPKTLRLAGYPVGPAWRHAIWLRETDTDYAEAQFFLGLSRDFPILSVGISVEKGLESPEKSHGRESFLMDRNVWDWPRLVERADEVLNVYVPSCGRQLGRPVVVRFRVIRVGDGESSQREVRTFVHDSGKWFERHVGTADPAEMLRYLGSLDKNTDEWVIAHITCDMSADDVKGMDEDALAETLLVFADLRSKIRARSAQG